MEFSVVPSELIESSSESESDSDMDADERRIFDLINLKVSSFLFSLLVSLPKLI